jgi:two-component system OmpR family sensor kinase
MARSIRAKLLWWLLAGVALAVAAGAYSIFRLARTETDALFDYQLQQMALSLRDQALANGFIVDDADSGERDVLIQIWDRRGVRLYISHPRVGMPDRAQLGFTDVAARDGMWRVFSIEARDHVVQVGQPYAVRNRLASDVALRMAWPVIAALPLLGLLIWMTVGNGLAPIVRLASEVRRRTPDSLQPVAERSLPSEVEPLAHALNDLLGRLSQSLDAQRAFVADAAHELRTPLTALSLQLQLAERATDPEERARALAALREGVARATRLVSQLLALARAESGGAAAGQPRERIQLDELARAAVAGHAAGAQARQIDLGLTSAEPLGFDASRALLESVLANLIENALKYTPAGGRVDLSVRRDGAQAVLEVSDTGPGIPAGERVRVFDRFYRGAPSRSEGSGLGLAIVRRALETLGGSIELADAQPHGLRAIVRLPLG